MTKLGKEIARSLQNPFRVYNSFSEKGNIISKREQDTDIFIKRLTAQILEYNQNNWSYSTPEEWDSHLSDCSLGKGKRSSASILSRMDWDQFLLRASLINDQI